jgi:hypothetical protein
MPRDRKSRASLPGLLGNAELADSSLAKEIEGPETGSDVGAIGGEELTIAASDL